LAGIVRLVRASLMTEGVMSRAEADAVLLVALLTDALVVGLWLGHRVWALRRRVREMGLPGRAYFEIHQQQ
jgi:hypothetical protein